MIKQKPIFKLKKIKIDSLYYKIWKNQLTPLQKLKYIHNNKIYHFCCAFFFYFLKGYAAVGYEYINVDDCWLEKNRGPNSELVADRARFPRGMKALSDYVSLVS